MKKHIYGLVLKDKGFSEELLFDLILSFQREESKEGLQAICSMLIRGNCTGGDSDDRTPGILPSYDSKRPISVS